jgi:hypothetical protein
MKNALIFAILLAAAPAAAELPQGAPSGVPAAAQNQPPQKRGNRFLEFYIPQALLAAAALAAASEAAARKYPQSARAVRNSWNWALLVSFAVCAALGLALLVPLDRALKGLVERVHIWAGVAALAAGVYHGAKRLRSMF